MSGGLAPSKSTVYVSNLPFSLTNSDLHKILEKYGKVVKVTIVKDKATRRSKGVAFVLFLEREFAHQCCRALNNTKMFGRTITCSIAKDNGRAAEFIRRKEYTDKTKCYECGDEGHLSYNCPKNLLGEREPPKKKERKRKKGADGEDIVESGEESDSSNQPEDPGAESLATAIQQQQNAAVGEKSLLPTDIVFGPSTSSWDEEPKKKKYKKDAYFSDEEELDGD